MLIKIARVVKSNSHVDYVGRIIDVLDADAPPGADDYGFAQFVSMPMGESEVVGVIYDSLLANPEYGNLGPRLSPRADLAVLSPDYLNEQGVLIGILLLGWRDGGSDSSGSSSKGQTVNHTVPRRVVPVGQEIYRMTNEAMHRFHRDSAGRLMLHYYSQILAGAGLLAVPLLEAIIEQLESACAKEEGRQLSVLRKSLAWQRTMGGMRL